MSELLIRLRGVHAAYGSGAPVLDSVDLELHAGERVGLIGPIGCGKTTLLHAIVGLVPTTAGGIEAFGRPRVEEPDFIEVRQRAGLLFQDPDDQLFCPTVIEDVAFGPLNLGEAREEAQAIARETLDSLGLAGYDDRICYKLSGGEKRLVSLATVLAMKPEVLLLDEPATGLDDRSAQRIMGILADLLQAMLIVSHDRRFLRQVTSKAATLGGGKLTRPTAWSDI